MKGGCLEPTYKWIPYVLDAVTCKSCMRDGLVFYRVKSTTWVAGTSLMGVDI